jgi:hypothetical protein
MFFEITVGKYKLRGEFIILALLLLWLLWGHLLCSCSRVSFSEGMETMKQISGKVAKKVEGMTNSGGHPPAPSAPFTNPVVNNKKTVGKEGFTSVGTGVGGNNYITDSAEFASVNMPPPDIKKWMPNSMLVTPGQSESQAVKEFLDRPSYFSSSLESGQLAPFSKMEFKPECCLENSYASASTGCACLSKGDYDVLRMRGGNNVPYSEF